MRRGLLLRPRLPDRPRQGARESLCVATVAAKAQRAYRERIARAVREQGKDNVEGGEEDELCVICQSKVVAPVQVSESGANDWKIVIEIREQKTGI